MRRDGRSVLSCVVAPVAGVDGQRMLVRFRVRSGPAAQLCGAGLRSVMRLLVFGVSRGAELLGRFQELVGVP